MKLKKYISDKFILYSLRVICTLIIAFLVLILVQRITIVNFQMKYLHKADIYMQDALNQLDY